MRGGAVIARLAFAVLVLATGAAFFIAQRVKRAPTAIQYAGTWTHLFSPNGDGVRDRSTFRLKLKESDDIEVSVVDADGDAVRTLASDRTQPAGRPFTIHWNGRTDAGRRAPDGAYQLRVGLRDEGRSITIPRHVTLDTAPPELEVTSIGPQATPVPRPELLPNKQGRVDIRFQGAHSHTPTFLVYRTTDPAHPRLVDRFRGRKGSNVGHWNGRIDGRPARAGTYLVVVRERDSAGNVGTSVPLPVRPGHVHGRGGVTVRYLAVRVPTAPVRGGSRATFTVDARGRRFHWDVRRPGAQDPVAHGAGTKEEVSARMPRGRSGVYLFEARAGRHSVQVPFTVQSPARAASHVLVVLPEMAWLGRAAIDDDGNGMPNLLDRGQPVHLDRMLSRLPASFAANEAPLLVWLDREHHDYDVTTDLALARRDGPLLGRYRGVLLAGDERWLPTGLRDRLRAFARDGGTVLSLGTESLRRDVRLTEHRLLDPGPPAPRDAFGARIAPVVHEPVNLLAAGGDTIQLFAYTGGAFPGFDAYEPTLGLPTGTEPAAYAADARGRPVLVAYRYGQGLIIRTGLPQWTSRLSEGGEVADVTSRMWSILSR